MDEIPLEVRDRFKATKIYSQLCTFPQLSKEVSQSEFIKIIADIQKDPKLLDKYYSDDPRIRKAILYMKNPNLTSSSDGEINSKDVMIALKASTTGDVGTLEVYLSIFGQLLLYQGNDSGMTVLHAAAESGQEKIIQHIINSNISVDPDVRTSKGSTPLMLAALKGHDAILKLLVNWGANINLVDHSNQSALDYALLNGSDHIVNYLIDTTQSNSELNPQSKQRQNLVISNNNHHHQQNVLNPIIMGADGHLAQLLETVEKLQHSLREANKKISKLEEQFQCVICMETEANAVLLDCAHMVSCWKCAQQLRNTPCPICNKVIIKIIKTFRS